MWTIAAGIVIAVFFRGLGDRASNGNGSRTRDSGAQRFVRISQTVWMNANVRIG